MLMTKNPVNNAFNTTTSITLSFNKIKNGDILALVNPGPPGKLPLKQRECIQQQFANVPLSV